MSKDVIKNMSKRIKDILMLPFDKHLVLLLFLFTTLLPYMWLLVAVLKYIPYGYVMGAHCFLLAYFVTLLVSLIKQPRIRSVIQAILVVLATVLFALNVYCLVEFQGLLDADYLMLILNTNVNEATEFLTSVLRGSIVLGVGGFLAIFVLLWLLSRRYHLGIGGKFFYPVMGLLVVMFVSNLYHKNVWRDGPIVHVPYLFYSLNKNLLPSDLALNSTHPAVTYSQVDQRPANVVLIIGESFSRSHSSLYGYEKQTNPRLGTLKNESLLFTFDSIRSADLRTSESISLMMGLCNKADRDNNDKKWYEYTTLIELMINSGYDTYWYSNQDRLGVYNGVARILAQSCNHVNFIRDGESMSRNAFDYELVDSSSQVIAHMDSNFHFVVYHLMGSHFDYRMRYPEEYDLFSEKDYPDRLNNQREVLAIYDNSILYNDFVVEQIINLFSDKDAVVVYVPDHGQDMFESAPDYFMHAKHNDPVSCYWGARIPFMVYASPSYIEHHPDMVRRMQERQNHPKSWDTEDLPYFIMDLIGAQTINGVAVKTRSVL